MIRFNTPSLIGRELDYLVQAIEAGRLATSGPFALKCADLLEQELGAARVLMTSSCTDALEMTALMLNLGPGDTVIVPSFTFTSTALAYARQGVNLRFADIEPDTFGIDPRSVASLLDDSVRAVVCVHYGGVPCRIDDLRAVLADRPGIDLIEDNAHGLFARSAGRLLGSFGRFSTLSFHETKNFQCGEGGALLINAEADVERAHILYDKGANRRAFMLGEVDKYTWKDVGSSFGMSDLQAAFLFAQLERSDEVLARRRRLDEMYRELLGPRAEQLGIALPIIPADSASAYHMFYIMTASRVVRDALLDGCKRRDIHPTFHYVPLHTSDAGRRFSDRQVDCPVSDDVSARLLRLPFFTAMTEQQVIEVCEAVGDVLTSLARE